MPASITLSDLAWAAPDRPPLFSHLSLSFGPVRTGLVGRNGVGKTTLLKLIAGDFRPRAGGVAVSGSLGVLRQAVQASHSETVADLFGATEALAVLRRADRGEATDEELADADWALETRMAAALGRVGLLVPPEMRLAALSGGQALRAGLACVLGVTPPPLLILDEPTNHLDVDSIEAVEAGLRVYDGALLVVSHSTGSFPRTGTRGLAPSARADRTSSASGPQKAPRSR
jgi:ATPase subunit of ABC transporter with duplicated ATPase domains